MEGPTVKVGDQNTRVLILVLQFTWARAQFHVQNGYNNTSPANFITREHS